MLFSGTGSVDAKRLRENVTTPTPIVASASNAVVMVIQRGHEPADVDRPNQP